MIYIVLVTIICNNARQIEIRIHTILLTCVLIITLLFVADKNSLTSRRKTLQVYILAGSANDNKTFQQSSC